MSVLFSILADALGMIIVDKILTALAMPLGLALCGFIVALGLAAAGWRRAGLGLAAALVALLWAASLPGISELALESLEDQYPVRALEEVPKADVIIVLGGGLRPAAAGNPYPDLGEAGDRVVHAWRLFNAGKAPRILLTGGNVFDSQGEVSEAGAMGEFLVALGVPFTALILEDRSRNTLENARFSAKIWQSEGFHSGLLVTSALHMPRALAAFRAAGLAVDPVSIDATSFYTGKPMPLALLPDSESLDRSTRALKEWLGLVAQYIRG